MHGVKENTGILRYYFGSLFHQSNQECKSIMYLQQFFQSYLYVPKNLNFLFVGEYLILI